MQTSVQSITHPPILVKPSIDGNGNSSGNSNGTHPPVHLKRCGHSTACGKDLYYFNGVISTSKVREVTCRSCWRVHATGVALRRKARQWEKIQNRQSAVTIKQPADIKRGGQVDLGRAFQMAVEMAERDLNHD